MNIYSNDGAYTDLGAAEVGEEKGTPDGNALTWLAGIASERKHFFKTLQGGGVEDLFRSNWRDGSYDRGTIFTSMGVRVIGVLPPTLNKVKSLLAGKEYDEECLSSEYRLQYELWLNSCRGLGGLTVEYSHFSNGTVETSTKVCDPSFIWSHETGAFYSTTEEGNGRQLNTKADPYTDVAAFADTLAVGLIRGGDTALGDGLRMRDGIW